MKYLECLDFSRRFLQSWQDVTRCDKMWQDMPSCPKLSTSGEEISMTQENWQKHAKTTVTYRKTWEWEEISWIKPCCIPVESHPCPRPLNPQPAPTCRYACKKSSFGERERSVQNRERKNSLDVKHNSYNSDMLQSYSIHWSMTQSVWLLELEFICPQTESMSMDSPPYDLNAGLFNLAKSW